jgi:hypothetical protein
MVAKEITNMSTSEKKIAANRRNGRKAPGPKDTSSTRFNATKHGLLANGLTELDDAEGFRETFRDLKRGDAQVLNNFLCECLALLIVRMRRIPRIEAECITGALHPPIHDETKNPLSMTSLNGPLLDPGQPARIREGHLNCLLKLQRYETAFQTMFFRFMDAVKQGRPKGGELLPAPAAVDVTVRHEQTDDSLSGCSHQQVFEGEFSEPGRQETADPADDCSAGRTQDEQAVGESFSGVGTDKDLDAAGNVNADADPAPWDPHTGSSEEQLLEDTDSEPVNEEEVDAER